MHHHSRLSRASHLLGLAVLTLVLTGAITHADSQPPPAKAPLILACEQADQRVVLLDSEIAWDDPKAVVWEWRAEREPKIAEKDRPLFRHPSDAKPLAGGSVIGLCASSGGVALIRVADGALLFHTKGPGNTHSIEMLPDGNLVTAGSSSDTVRLYAMKATPPTETDHKVVDAHGLLWDAKRKRLWAMGGKVLKAFEYNFDAEKPALTEVVSLSLPETEEGKKEPRYGGHDLSMLPGGDRFAISDEHYVWQFDAEKQTFAPWPDVAGKPVHAIKDVKSMSQVVADGPILIMQAETQWWSPSVRELGSDRVRTLPGAKFYKARWWTGEPPGPRSKG